MPKGKIIWGMPKNAMWGIVEPLRAILKAILYKPLYSLTI